MGFRAVRNLRGSPTPPPAIRNERWGPQPPPRHPAMAVGGRPGHTPERADNGSICARQRTRSYREDIRARAQRTPSRRISSHRLDRGVARTGPGRHAGIADGPRLVQDLMEPRNPEAFRDLAQRDPLPHAIKSGAPPDPCQLFFSCLRQPQPQFIIVSHSQEDGRLHDDCRIGRQATRERTGVKAPRPAFSLRFTTPKSGENFDLRAFETQIRSYFCPKSDSRRALPYVHRESVENRAILPMSSHLVSHCP